jgi:hypothetical protein
VLKDKTYELVSPLNKYELLWGKTFWILVTGAPIMIAKNNYVPAELNKTKRRTLRDRFLFFVCAVFIKNHFV